GRLVARYGIGYSMRVLDLPLRKTLLISVCVALVLVLSLGDNHTCVQSGPCVGCLHTSGSVLTTGFSHHIAFIDFGASTLSTSPKAIGLLVLPPTPLRAPPVAA